MSDIVKASEKLAFVKVDGTNFIGEYDEATHKVSNAMRCGPNPTTLKGCAFADTSSKWIAGFHEDTLEEISHAPGSGVTVIQIAADQKVLMERELATFAQAKSLAIKKLTINEYLNTRSGN